MAKTGQSHCPISHQSKGTLRHTDGQDTIYRFPIYGSSAVLLDKDKMLIFKYLYYLVCS